MVFFIGQLSTEAFVVERFVSIVYHRNTSKMKLFFRHTCKFLGPYCNTLHWLNIPERMEYKVISLTYVYIHFNPLSPPTCTSVSCSRLNQPPRAATFYSSTLALPELLSPQNCQLVHSHSCPAFWSKLQPVFRTNQNLTSYYLSTVLSLKTETLHCSLTNPLLIHPPSLPVSTLSTIHHSRLTVSLPDSLTLDP